MRSDWRVLDALREVAVELGRTPAQVALAWVLGRPCVVTTLIGARTLEQLTGNLAAFEVDLDADQVAKLDAASAPEPVSPYLMLTGETHQLAMSAGATIAG